MIVSVDQFIEESNRLDDSDKLFELYKNAMEKLGYDRIVYSLITDHQSMNKKSGHGIMANYPEDWLKYYEEKSYGHKDPVPKQAFKTNNIFTWDQIAKTRDLEEEEKEVMNGAREANLLDGVGHSDSWS